MSKLSQLFKIPSHTVIVGKTDSGKSHILKLIIKIYVHKVYFHLEQLLTTTSFNGDWDCIPKDFHINPNNAEAYIKQLLIILKKLKLQGITVHGFLIIDDCLASLSWNDSLWTKVATTIRHYGVSLFITTQYFLKLPPVIRTQASQLIFMKMFVNKELKACWESCFPFMKYSEFIDFIRKNTQKYSAIFVNNHAQTNNDSELYKIIKAPAYIAPFFLKF